MYNECRVSVSPILVVDHVVNHMVDRQYIGNKKYQLYKCLAIIPYRDMNGHLYDGTTIWLYVIMITYFYKRTDLWSQLYNQPVYLTH